MSQSAELFSVVTYAEAGISGDGHVVLCRVETREHGTVRFGLKIGEVHDFVTLLLRLVAVVQDGSPPAGAAFQTIPAAAVSVGTIEGDVGCLGVTVGTRELAFEVPLSAMPRIGQALMMASAAPAQRLA